MAISDLNMYRYVLCVGGSIRSESNQESNQTMVGSKKHKEATAKADLGYDSDDLH